MISLVDYEPFQLLRQFNEASGLPGRPWTGRVGKDAVRNDYCPPVEILEDAKEFVLEAEVPGVAPDQIEVSTENSVLSLKGEWRSAPGQEGEDTAKDQEREQRREQRQGQRFTFGRRFNLPESVDQGKIRARCEHGLLRIVLPKRAQSQARRIAIDPS